MVFELYLNKAVKKEPKKKEKEKEKKSRTDWLAQRTRVIYFQVKHLLG